MILRNEMVDIRNGPGNAALCGRMSLLCGTMKGQLRIWASKGTSRTDASKS